MTVVEVELGIAKVPDPADPFPPAANVPSVKEPVVPSVTLLAKVLAEPAQLSVTVTVALLPVAPVAVTVPFAVWPVKMQPEPPWHCDALAFMAACKFCAVSSASVSRAELLPPPAESLIKT
jgi:hypothetical protein